MRLRKTKAEQLPQRIAVVNREEAISSPTSSPFAFLVTETFGISRQSERAARAA